MEQSRTGGQGGAQQTKGLGCEPRSHLEEGRANLHPARTLMSVQLTRVPRGVSMSGWHWNLNGSIIAQFLFYKVSAFKLLNGLWCPQGTL